MRGCSATRCTQATPGLALLGRDLADYAAIVAGVGQ
jgi:hypothetical protein